MGDLNGGRKPRILIVNAYFDPWRSATPTRLFIPRAMAPYYLAGHINAQNADIKVWDEVYHGALLNQHVFEWPDMIVLTGLTAAFDRARQLAAYCRHGNPNVVTVIGGPMARALPQICSDVFDYVCQGDVEDLRDVLQTVYGNSLLAQSDTPRFDLTAPSLGTRYLETTKNCNFACSFCSLSGESRAYQAHSDDFIERQLDAVDRAFVVMVLDNNFFGNNRRSFEHRVRLIGERWRKGQFRAWGALVTGDFFKKPDHLALMAENGCKGLFSGVETLDPDVLAAYNKKQSLTADLSSMTEVCAQKGVNFDYGMIIDFSRQTTADVDEHLSSILADKRVPLPSLLSLTIPIVGTPYFDEAARSGRILPNVLLSDMDGQKLVEWPQEPIETVVPFLKKLLTFKGRKTALLNHATRHAWHWRKHFEWQQSIVAFLRPLQRFGGRIDIGSLRQMRQTWAEPKLTYCANTETKRLAYKPLFNLPSAFEKDFEPLVITASDGSLSEDFLRARGL